MSDRNMLPSRQHFVDKLCESIDKLIDFAELHWPWEENNPPSLNWPLSYDAKLTLEQFDIEIAESLILLGVPLPDWSNVETYSGESHYPVIGIVLTKDDRLRPPFGWKTRVLTLRALGLRSLMELKSEAATRQSDVSDGDDWEHRCEWKFCGATFQYQDCAVFGLTGNCKEILVALLNARDYKIARNRLALIVSRWRNMTVRDHTVNSTISNLRGRLNTATSGRVTIKSEGDGADFRYELVMQSDTSCSQQ